MGYCTNIFDSIFIILLGYLVEFGFSAESNLLAKKKTTVANN